LRFNLSNTPDLVVCLIAQGAEVGVDVESCERAEEIIELAPAVFSPVERAQLDALHGSGKLGHALSLWTLKEAYMKATGMGLSLPFKQFSFLLGGTEGIRLEFDPLLDDQPVQRWRFCLMEHAHHRIALMVESTKVPELKLWEVKPLFPPSMKPELRREQWFPASA
jgi:4'-phosphopantetheinyl transferase